MAELYIHYGENAASMVMELMAAADIASRLNAGMKVCIKPNLVVPRPAAEGATTHPEVVEGVIRYLQGAGIEDITVAEGAWVGASTSEAFASCGYDDLARRYGVKLLDSKKDGTVKRQLDGQTFQFCETMMNADYLINVPVLKGHCQTNMTCCLKNMKGCIPDSEKRRYHATGLHRPIALLNTVVRPDLHVVDGVCGDLTFEEGGNPVTSNRIMLGFDPVLLDSYGAGLMGYHPDEIEHLRLAQEMGVGRYADGRTKIRELGRENRPGALPARSGAVKRLSAYVEERSACSACYAALIFALNKTGRTPGEKVKIGQGFRGVSCEGAGVGNCTAGCRRYVPGCPPSALDIVDFLEG